MPKAKENPQKNKVAPESQELSKSFNYVYRFILAAILFIGGFNFSYSSFFRDNPLYGVPYLAEILISITAAFIGFYLIPMLFLQLKDWLETLIINTISDIVRSFWDQQSKRITDRRRDKQKQLQEVEKQKLKEDLLNAIVVDTSVLVDGRILDVVKTGFLDNTLVIAAEVTNELHQISDSGKKLKRERGRRGLDIAKKLKSATKVIMPTIGGSAEGVDAKILQYAKDNKLKMLTLDFNLNKLAQANGVKVLNINDLVNAVKLNVLPGESLTVTISQEGKEKKQGVGYMPDGTMIVVEEAKELVGDEVLALVQRVIQSSAGKIIFCDLAKNGNEGNEK